MSVADWLRKRATAVNTGNRPPAGQVEYHDLAQLAAVQHEFISAHWEIKHKRCEHGSCKSLRMAAALMEKYE